MAPDTGSPPDPVTHRRVLAIAVPVVVSNATVPLQGAIDTAIIGNQGSELLLAAVVLGATALTLLFTAFNFLQMGASGLTAEALGAGDARRVVNTLLRALIVAAAVALAMILARGPLAAGALALFAGSAEAEALAAEYVRLRLFGAPAELANYALIGWFTGQAQTRRLVEMQIAVSVVNVGLNLVFVVGLGWGVQGVATATAIAAWAGLGVGLWRARARIAAIRPGFRPELARLFDTGELARVAALNRDIFLRTLCLTGGFAWFARLGSLQGDTVLAANGVLMQFVHVSAYALDGFAMAAETLVGQALGRRDADGLARAVRVTGGAALALACLLAALFTLAGPTLIRLMSDIPEVRTVAGAHALWATLLPLAGVLAYQMDGVFIGAAEGRLMRNAMLAAAGLFALLGWVLASWLNNHGIWIALWMWMLLRAGFLAALYPRIVARARS